MTTLTGKFCRALVAQSLFVKLLCAEMSEYYAAVKSLCGPMVILRKDGKSTRSQSFEEPLWDFAS
jgi:hypothetical protein